MRTPSLPFTLTTVPFSRTRCGVDFNIAVGDYSDLQGALMEHPIFKTDYFQLFFFWCRSSIWVKKAICDMAFSKSS